MRKKNYLTALAGAGALAAAVTLVTAANATTPDRAPVYVSLEGVSDYQVKVLTSGLTVETYEQSIEDAVQCIRDGGVAVTDPLPVDDYGSHAYIFSGEGAVPESEVTKIADACQQDYHSAIDLQWAESLTNGTGPHQGKALVDGDNVNVATFPTKYELKN